MKWKRLLEGELICLFFTIIVLLSIWVKEGLTMTEDFLFLSISAFIVVSTINFYVFFFKKRKNESEIEKLGRPALWIGGYITNIEGILRRYNISKKESLKIHLTLFFVWMFILLFSAAIAGVVLLILIDKTHLILTFTISLISSFICFSFIERIYWIVFKRLLKPYTKKLI